MYANQSTDSCSYIDVDLLELVALVVAALPYCDHRMCRHLRVPSSQVSLYEPIICCERCKFCTPLQVEGVLIDDRPGSKALANRRRPFAVVATPLASIFGSGFLVIVPVLAHAVGSLMVYAMIAVTALAYAVGAVIRFNIAHAEALIGTPDYRITTVVDRFSDATIVLAYVISIALYLHILSAFLLTGLGHDSAVAEDALTTGIIGLIVLIGVLRGLDVLNFLEQWALYATLGLVALVLFGFVLYDVAAFSSPVGFVLPSTPIDNWWAAVTIVSGTLIVVQGFETPRFLGDSFSSEDRVWGSRLSQIISITVYVAFVALALPVIHELQGQFDDNSLITLVGFTVIPYLAVAVVAAAVLSQFSAAVADMLAAEGNVAEVSNHRSPARMTYLLIGAAAIALTWVADTFEIIALASRAFACYYFLQCVVGAIVAKSVVQRIAMIGLAATMLFIVIFAAPVS